MAESAKKSPLPKWVPPWRPAVAAERARRVASGEAAADPSATYTAGCHCGALALEVTLSPPLEQGHMVNVCNCSACTRLGYMLVYPERSQVRWRRGGGGGGGGGGGDPDSASATDRDRCGVYRFNTRQIDHLFCQHCGSSLGIDFRGRFLPAYDGYGINVRSFKDVDLDSLTYGTNDGKNNVPPMGDVSGKWYEGQRKE